MKILKLQLKSRNLQPQKQFYCHLLGFPLIKEGKDFFIIKVGSSQLHFVLDEKAVPYHFAFNIPSFSEPEALQWLKQKVNIFSR